MSPPRPKVLVLASTFPRWNGDRQPRFVLDLCKGLADRFDILVLAPHAPGAALAETLEGIPVRRFRYWIPRWQSLAYGGGMLEQVRGNPLRLLQLPFLLSALILATRRALADDGHSLIHAHWIIPQGVAAAAVRGRTPLVCTAHGADAFGLRAKPFLALKRWVLGRSTALTVVSEAIASQLRPLLPHPMDTPVMPMGADLRDTFTPDESVEREPMRLVFAGRMVEKKGVEVLLRALPVVLDKHPGIRLHIVGTGPREATLNILATDLGLGARVVFHGALDHVGVAEQFRRASLCIVPSIIAAGGDREGFGLVVAEAMGCACPVLASDLPAIRDQIRDGQNGWLFEAGNPQALGEALKRCLDDNKALRRIGLAGRETALAAFDWQAVSAGYAELYDSLMQPHTTRLEVRSEK